MIIDAFSYNGEKDILRLHLAILGGQVDKFIICEAKTTFSGHQKPLYFFQHQRYFKPWWHQIEYYVIDEDYSPEEIDLANNSPNTLGAQHWKREFLQKESIKKALVKNNVQDEDIVYIGDVDEIWSPIGLVVEPMKLKLQVYNYYLNNESDEQFWGTLVSPYSHLKDACLNHLRSDCKLRTPVNSGWHFTWMGGFNEARRKLNDSYTTESYNTVQVQYNLPNAVRERKDVLNRPFIYIIDESHWPNYLKKNRAKYQHLLWQS